MMDESSPLATLGEHIAKLSSLGKANGYGKCKDRLPKYLCPARGVGCIGYLTLPFLTLHILSTRTDGDGPSLSPTRHDIPPTSSTSAPPASPWRSYYVSFFHSISISTWRHINIGKKSTCQTVITPTSFHPRGIITIITIYTNPVESDHAISTFPTFPSFSARLHGVCNSLSETISIYFFPDLPSDLSHLQTKDKIRYEDNDTKNKACCLRHFRRGKRCLAVNEWLERETCF